MLYGDSVQLPAKSKAIRIFKIFFKCAGKTREASDDGTEMSVSQLMRAITKREMLSRLSYIRVKQKKERHEEKEKEWIKEDKGRSETEGERQRGRDVQYYY